jgi:hypothetical protein
MLIKGYNALIGIKKMRNAVNAHAAENTIDNRKIVAKLGAEFHIGIPIKMQINIVRKVNRPRQPMPRRYNNVTAATRSTVFDSLPNGLGHSNVAALNSTIIPNVYGQGRKDRGNGCFKWLKILHVISP